MAAGVESVLVIGTALSSSGRRALQRLVIGCPPVAKRADRLYLNRGCWRTTGYACRAPGGRQSATTSRRAGGPALRTPVLTQVRNLIEFARQHGYQRAEIIQMINDLPQGRRSLQATRSP